MEQSSLIHHDDPCKTSMPNEEPDREQQCKHQTYGAKNKPMTARERITDDNGAQASETKGTNTGDEPSSAVKYGFTICVCIVGFGDYFIEDNPAALHSNMLKDLYLSERSFALFYSALSWVSMLSCLVSGYVLDKLLGYRLGVTIFMFGLAGSQVLFGCGALIGSYWTMVAGRALIGLCSPMSAISADIMVIRWYKGGGLALLLGLRASIARFASVIQLNVMGRIYEGLNGYVHGHTCLGLTLLIASSMCFISALAALVAVQIDRKYTKDVPIAHDKEDIIKTKPSDWIKVIKSMNVLFWLITFSTATFYIGVFPFVAFGQIFYVMKYSIDVKNADTLNSLVYLVAATTLPIFGYLSDRTGRTLFYLLSGVCFAIVGHFMLAFTFTNPYVGTVILGIGYSITTAAVWPLATFVTEERNLGTAFSIMNTVINVLQTGMQYLSGYLVDTYGYFILHVFFVFSTSVALVFSCLLYLVDSYNGGHLNLTGTARSRRKSNEKAQS